MQVRTKGWHLKEMCELAWRLDIWASCMMVQSMRKNLGLVPPVMEINVLAFHEGKGRDNYYVNSIQHDAATTFSCEFKV